MRRRPLIGIGVAAATLALAAAALGYFSSSGTGHVSATVGTLSAPVITGTTPGAGTVALTWTGVTPPAGGTVTYYITRTGGTVGGNCPSSAATATTSLSCTDAGLARGTYKYTVTAVWQSWTALSSQASATLASGAATNLAFTAQPTSGQNIQATGTGSFAVAVAVQDANGNTVTSDNSTAITLAIGTNPGGGALTCTNTGGLGPVTVSSGIASFTGCAVTKTGTGYTLTATSNPAHTTPTNANAFNITAGTAAKVGITASPASAIGSTTTNVQLNLQLQDTNGNSATSSGTTTLTLSTSSANGFFASSSGVSGSATFNVTFGSGIGTGTAWYGDKSFGSPTITAKNGASGWGTASPTITASQFVVTAQTTTPTAGAADNLTIKAEDATGAVATTYTGSHNLTFGGASSSPAGNNPTVTSSTGTATAFGSATAVNFTNGQATVSGSSNGQMILYDAQTASVTVTDGTIHTASGLSITVSPPPTPSTSASNYTYTDKTSPAKDQIAALSGTVTAGSGETVTSLKLAAVATSGPNTGTSYTSANALSGGRVAAFNVGNATANIGYKFYEVDQYGNQSSTAAGPFTFTDTK